MGLDAKIDENESALIIKYLKHKGSIHVSTVPKLIYHLLKVLQIFMTYD